MVGDFLGTAVHARAPPVRFARRNPKYPTLVSNPSMMERLDDG